MHCETESAKLCATHALVLYVPRALHALVSYVLLCLTCLVPYVLLCFTYLVPSVLLRLTCLVSSVCCILSILVLLVPGAPRALVLLIPHLLEVFQVNILIRISCIIAWMSCASCAVGAGIIWAFLFGLRLIIVMCHFLKRNTATLFFRISNKSFQDLLTPLH